MERNCNFDDISDGKLYENYDMARLGCNDCKGCSSCCQKVGATIVLDPYDIARMSVGTGLTQTELFHENLELNVVDGIILPNLKMAGSEEKCTFLNADGRCSIHSYRPGICRLFPLGRIYDNGGFKYFLQKDECKITNRSKVKISKWLDTPELTKYEKYINDWHYFLKDTEEELKNYDETVSKNMSMYILKEFFLKKYNMDTFYTDFYERLAKARAMF